MSRIGLRPITIPEGVEVTVGEKNLVTVKGPKGTLSRELNREMKINIENGIINVERPSDAKRHKSMHGLSRTLIANMVEGVSKGFEKQLEIIGTGYRAAKKGKELTMNLGFSHQVIMEDPEGIEVEVPANTKIVVKGIDKQKVGNYAAIIRAWRKPEPYKGKGIRYVGEHVRRKEGKTGK